VFCRQLPGPRSGPVSGREGARAAPPPASPALPPQPIARSLSSSRPLACARRVSGGNECATLHPAPPANVGRRRRGVSSAAYRGASGAAAAAKGRPWSRARGGRSFRVLRGLRDWVWVATVYRLPMRMFSPYTLACVPNDGATIYFHIVRRAPTGDLRDGLASTGENSARAARHVLCFRSSSACSIRYTCLIAFTVVGLENLSCWLFHIASIASHRSHRIDRIASNLALAVSCWERRAAPRLCCAQRRRPARSLLFVVPLNQT